MTATLVKRGANSRPPALDPHAYRVTPSIGSSSYSLATQDSQHVRHSSAPFAAQSRHEHGARQPGLSEWLAFFLDFGFVVAVGQLASVPWVAATYASDRRQMDRGLVVAQLSRLPAATSTVAAV